MNSVFKFVLKLSVLVFATQISYADISQQAEHYTSHLGDYGSTTAIMKRSPLNRGSEMRPKTVLKGVFYFGGSDVRRRLLSRSTRGFLCESGFSSVYSVYDAVSTTVRCDGGSMSYTKIGEARGRQNGGTKVRQLLENIYDVIKSGGERGPIFVHCWYGVHASNTIAQIVTKQFCGDNGRLASNWDKVDIYNSLGARGRRKQLAKIANFRPYSDLTISSAEREAICY